MATLTQDLGFPDASVVVFSTGDTVVALVDPEHADRVVLKPELSGEGYVPAGWEPGLELLREFQMAFQVAIIHYGEWLTEGPDQAMGDLGPFESEAENAEAISAFLEEHSEPEDLDQSMWSLQNNADSECRQLAAALLINLHERDVAWWALIEGVRDSDQRVSGACSQALRVMGEKLARPVDWRPVSRTIAHLLDGTRIAQFSSVVAALGRTEIDPELAPLVLQGGAPALLDFVAAETEFFHSRALALLTRLSGEDHGRDRAAWSQWIESARDGVPGK